MFDQLQYKKGFESGNNCVLHTHSQETTRNRFDATRCVGVVVAWSCGLVRERDGQERCVYVSIDETEAGLLLNDVKLFGNIFQLAANRRYALVELVEAHRCQ